MHLIERQYPNGDWHVMDRSKDVRVAVREFLSIVGLSLDVVDIARDVRRGQTFYGVSKATGRSMRLRDGRVSSETSDRVVLA